MRFNRMKSLRRTVVTGTVALAATGAFVGVASPANAAEHNGVCETGELCLYWYQNFGPPLYDMLYSDPNFSGTLFPGSTIAVDNNTRSYWNRDTFYWRVYDGPNYTGDELQCIAPGVSGNFSTGDWDRASSANFSSNPC